MRYVILAGGKSSRFEGEKSKLVQTLNGKTVIEHVREQLDGPVTVITNNEDVKNTLKDVEFSHARENTVESVRHFLNDCLDTEIIFILGDLPLLPKKEIREFYRFARHKKAGLMVTQTGRTEFMWVAYRGDFPLEVSHDFTGIGDVGCYYFKTAWLERALPKARETLNSLVNVAYKQRQPFVDYLLENQELAHGVNTVEDLVEVRLILERSLTRS